MRYFKKAPFSESFYSLASLYAELLLLRDRMNTETGRKLAEERHRFMEQFLHQFYEEWGEPLLEKNNRFFRQIKKA